MAQIIRGEYDRSKRLAVVSEADQERREAVEEAQRAVQAGEAIMGKGRRNVLNIIVGALATAFVLPILYVVARFVTPPERKKKMKLLHRLPKSPMFHQTLERLSSSMGKSSCSSMSMVNTKPFQQSVLIFNALCSGKQMSS